MRQMLVYIASILLHEIFHIISAGAFYHEKLSIIFLPTGFAGRWKSFQPEKWAQCIIYAFGPLGNIITATIFAIVPLRWDLRVDFVRANLVIGLFNLIPLYPMDGGSILLVLLYNSVGSNRAYNIMKNISYAVRILLSIAGLYNLIFHKNPSMILCIIFLPGIVSIKRSVRRLNLSSLIRRKQRFLKRKNYEMRSILIHKSVSLGEALLLLDYDRYHIIHIADEKLNILCQVTEQQLIDTMMEHNVGKTLEEVFIKDM